MSNTVGVMSLKWWLDVIKKNVMSCIVQKMKTLSECEVIQSVCDVVNRVRVMTQIIGCNVTCIVYMWPTYCRRFHI